MPYGFRQPQAPQQPQQQEKGSPLAAVVWLLVLGLLVAGGAYWVWLSPRDHIAKAVAGDCLEPVAGDEDSPYRIVDCTDPAGQYKVLEAIKLGGDAKKCRDVAGASRSVTTAEHTLCIAKKDVDPAKAVNVAVRGDCLSITGKVAERVSCSDPRAKYEVLRRLADVADFQLANACDGVTGAAKQYEWNWESDGQGRAVSKLMVDLVLCLGER